MTFLNKINCVYHGDEKVAYSANEFDAILGKNNTETFKVFLRLSP